MQSGSRLLALDVLRGIAAVVVMLHHYLYHFDEIYGHPQWDVGWADIGRYGVELFFMLSGFVIFWSLQRTEQPLDFVVSRFSRLFPAYWAAIALTFVTVSLVGLPGREVSGTEALWNLSMVHQYLDVPHVDGVYWTLVLELTFYFWIFLAWLANNLRHIEWLFAAVIGVSVLHHSGVFALDDDLRRAFLLTYLPFFLIGMCVYNLYAGRGVAWQQWGLVGYSLLASAVIFSPALALLFTGFAALLYLAVSGRLAFLVTPPLLWLGGISYALYLIHQNIGYIIIRHFYAEGWQPALGVAVAVLVSLLLASLMAVWVERPAMAWIRSRWRSAQRLSLG